MARSYTLVFKVVNPPYGLGHRHHGPGFSAALQPL